MSNVTNSVYVVLLSITALIGIYNWIYKVRIEKVRHQLGLELPGLSIALMKIGTFFAIFSVGLMVFFILFMN